MRRIVAGLLITVFIAISYVYGMKTLRAQEDKKMTKDANTIRPAILARQGWYDADPAQLRATVENYLRHAKVSPDIGDVIGLIAPHAGYRYSGPVAAYSYRQIQGKKYDTVIVIAPNHRDPRLTYSSVMTEGGYSTPLGVVKVDTETARAIAGFDSSDNVMDSTVGHLPMILGEAEHSLEIQLPFLQVVLGDFTLVPIIMGDQTARSCKVLAEAIVAAAKNKKVLMVGSTDLSHFYTADQADKLDGVIREHVAAFDVEGLMRDVSAKKCQACGAAPMAVVMMASARLGADTANVLQMANSGDVTGDDSSVVGYMAAVLTAKGGGEAQKKEVGVNLGLSDEEKKILKDVVQKTLDSVVNGSPIPSFPVPSGKLGEKWGAFVTLNKNGRLRGCIGYIVGTQPLITTVAQMTRAAALEDPRFSPVKPPELKDIEFEISVLTPIREIKDVSEIVVGRDGIIITRGYSRGLLLPQVATEYGWDRDTFLEQTCYKAGLPGDAWKQSGTKIEIFSAEIIQ